MITTPTAYRVGYANVYGNKELNRIGETPFVAQGSSISTQTNTYTISDVAGSVPIQGPSMTTKQESSASLSMPMPMDNPPLSSGGIPTNPQFSGLSTSNGLEPTVSMQLHPTMMHREHLMHADPKECEIETIMNRRGLLRVFNWSTEEPENTVKLTMPLNSIFFDWDQSVGAFDLPTHLAFLNYFLFWRADIVLSFYGVRTSYQSGRLAVTAAYGAPGITPGEQNLFLNEVVDFNNENDWGSITIPYNAATEFLRTYDGPGATNPVQNYSLGSLMVTVRNRLRVTGQIVADNIQVLVFVSMKNVRVYEARPFPTCVIREGFANFVVTVPSVLSAGVPAERRKPNPVIPPTDPEMDFEAQGGDTETSAGAVVAQTHEEADELSIETTEMTSTESSVMANIPCRLDIGRKFEYCPSNLNELIRRHGSVFQINAGINPSGNMVTTDVMPMSPFRHMYAGWAGHLKYRIFKEGPNSLMKTIFIPTLGPTPKADFIMTPGATEQVYDATTPTPNVLTIQMANRNVNYSATEMMFPLGNTAHTATAATDSEHWIDVSVPFSTIFNFHPCDGDTTHSIPTRIGVLGIGARGAMTGGPPGWKTYQAAGDDFTFMIWRPPVRSSFSPFTENTPATLRGGQNLAGFIL